MSRRLALKKRERQLVRAVDTQLYWMSSHGLDIEGFYPVENHALHELAKALKPYEAIGGLIGLKRFQEDYMEAYPVVEGVGE